MLDNLFIIGSEHRSHRCLSRSFESDADHCAHTTRSNHQHSALCRCSIVGHTGLIDFDIILEDSMSRNYILTTKVILRNTRAPTSGFPSFPSLVDILPPHWVITPNFPSNIGNNPIWLLFTVSHSLEYDQEETISQCSTMGVQTIFNITTDRMIKSDVTFLYPYPSK